MATDVPLIVQQIGKNTIVEFNTISLMDPPLLERVGEAIYRLVDEEDRRNLILDFGQVKFISSQAIGVLLTLKKKLDALPKSGIVLCGVGPALAQLMKITRLDRVLAVKSNQAEALRTSIP